MNCWIVVYTHRHGADVWPVFRAMAPSEESITDDLLSWEPDQGEQVEVRGPFEVPKEHD